MTEDRKEDTEENGEVNISRLREMALRGDDYRETIEFVYYDMEGKLVLRPLPDPEFLPIAALLEDRLDLSPEQAQEQLEDAEEEGAIDPAEFDREFVDIMQKAAVFGIDTTEGIAEGEDHKGIEEIVKMLQGGKSLVIAQRVLEMSSDAEKAESFRRDGSRE